MKSPGRIAAVLLLAASALPLAAQMPETPPGKWWKRPRVVEKLGIRADQQERLEEIFAKNRRAFVDLKAEVERRQIDLEELMTKKDSDPKKVSSAVDALEQARFRLSKARTMMNVEMKGILTAEQWQTILDLREQWRRERMEDRRKPRAEGREGGKERPARPPPAEEPEK